MTPTDIHPLKWRWMHFRRVVRQRHPGVDSLGWGAYFMLNLAPVFGRGRAKSLRTIRLRGYDLPFHYRLNSSDAGVIQQVFGDQDYGCVAQLPGVRTIIDCGGNIGATSFYLLHRYPDARVVVVEPDSANMALCRKNLAPFADRVTFVQAGVWSTTTPMIVERGTYRDGKEWSIQVRPARTGEKADFEAVTIPDLMVKAGFDSVDLLKVDIEAAEKEVFSNAAGWINRIGSLVIELHGPDCEAAVQSAVTGRPAQVSTSGELTLYRFQPTEVGC